MADKLCVIASEGARTPYRDELGRMTPGRFFGRDHDGNACAEEVLDTSEVRRALRRGDLHIATPNDTTTDTAQESDQ